MTHEEVMSVEKINGKYVKTIETTHDDLTDEHILNEYIGALRQKLWLVKEYQKNEARLATLETTINDLCDEYAELACCVEEAQCGDHHADKVRTLEDIRTKMALYSQLKAMDTPPPVEE